MDHETRRLDEPIDHETRRLDEPPPANNCPKCEGERIWGEIPTYGSNGLKVARTLPGQGPLGFNKTAYAACHALVCLQCGYTELYTQQPRDLLGDS